MYMLGSCTFLQNKIMAEDPFLSIFAYFCSNQLNLGIWENKCFPWLFFRISIYLSIWLDKLGAILEVLSENVVDPLQFFFSSSPFFQTSREKPCVRIYVRSSWFNIGSVSRCQLLSRSYFPPLSCYWLYSEQASRPPWVFLLPSFLPSFLFKEWGSRKEEKDGIITKLLTAAVAKNLSWLWIKIIFLQAVPFSPWLIKNDNCDRRFVFKLNNLSGALFAINGK